MAFPALRRLRARFGSLHAICPGRHGQLAEALGLIDRFYPVESAMFATLYSPEVAPRALDILSASTGVLFLSFSKEPCENVRPKVGVDVYRVDPLPPPAREIRVFRHLLEALSALGLIGPDDGGRLAGCPPANFPRLPEMPKAAGTVLLHPGAGSKRKRWPLNRFLTLADSLESAGLFPRLLIGPAEEELAGAIHEYRGGNYPVVRAANLVDLAARLRSVAGFVGNDAGVAHLAAFLGVPTVAIFGPAAPARWAPAGPFVSVVRPPVDCAACFETLPENCDGERPRCLYDTHPADVEEALHAVLKKQAGISRRIHTVKPACR